MHIYILCLAMFVVGIYAIMVKRHIIKKIIGLAILEFGVNLFLILVGYRKDGIAPILSRGDSVTRFVNNAVDPLPQALVLTAIVIGLGTLALMVSLAIKLHEKYGTYDMDEIKKLRG